MDVIDCSYICQGVKTHFGGSAKDLLTVHGMHPPRVTNYGVVVAGTLQ